MKELLLFSKSEMFRGVYPEHHEWAQHDNNNEIFRASRSKNDTFHSIA